MIDDVNKVDWAALAKDLPAKWQFNIDNSGVVVLNANGPVYGYFPVQTEADMWTIVDKAEVLGLLEAELRAAKEEFNLLQKGT